MGFLPCRQPQLRARHKETEVGRAPSSCEDQRLHQGGGVRNPPDEVPVGVGAPSEAHGAVAVEKLLKE